MATPRTISLPVRSIAPDDPRRIRRSRSGPRRAIVLAVVQVLIVAHIVQWAVTGRTLSPLEPSESMDLVTRGVVNAGAILFGVALLSTLVLGRWFCGWGCHVVMLQDACAWLMRRVGVRPRAFRSRLLMAVPFILALYMFVWPVVYRWGVAPLLERHHDRFGLAAPAPLADWTGFSAELVTEDFWATFPPWYVAVPLLLVCGFACVYFLGAKGFCTYGCPYGGFFAPLDQYAPGRIRVTDACEQCGHCTAVCSSNVRVHDEVREYGMVVDPGCMKCLDCVSVCPNDALYFGFGRPASAKGAAKHRAPAPRWDLGWGEELAAAAVFAGTFFAVRGVYELVPMLGAAAIAGIATFAAWKLWRMTRDASVSHHRRRLRFRGALTASGWIFATATGLGLALVAHSGAVRLVLAAAERADRRVTISRDAIFAAAPLTMSDDMAAHADRAIALYRRAGPIGAGGIGLLDTPRIAPRLAWLHSCRHEFDVAEAVLRERVGRAGVTDALARDIVMLMHMQDRPDAAEAYAGAVTETHPEFVQTLDALVLWLANEGRADEAMRRCEAALSQLADHPRERLFVMRRLSLLFLEHGRTGDGIELLEETITIDDTNVAAFVLLARAYRDEGDDAAAITAMRRAVTLAPDREDLVEDLRRLEGRP